MSPLLKNLIIALCITLILWVAYIFTLGKSDVENTDMPASDSVAGQLSQKILADTQKIDAYTMDVSIVSDKRFISFIDTRIELVDVNTGRSNPFAPTN